MPFSYLLTPRGLDPSSACSLLKEEAAQAARERSAQLKLEAEERARERAAQKAERERTAPPPAAPPAASETAPAGVAVSTTRRGAARLRLEALEAIRSEAYADDVPIDFERMCEWSADRARRFFESGGEEDEGEEDGDGGAASPASALSTESGGGTGIARGTSEEEPQWLRAAEDTLRTSAPDAAPPRGANDDTDDHDYNHDDDDDGDDDDDDDDDEVRPPSEPPDDDDDGDGGGDAANDDIDVDRASPGGARVGSVPTRGPHHDDESAPAATGGPRGASDDDDDDEVRPPSDPPPDEEEDDVDAARGHVLRALLKRDTLGRFKIQIGEDDRGLYLKNMGETDNPDDRTLLTVGVLLDSIDGQPVESLSLHEAREVIKAAGETLELAVIIDDDDEEEEEEEGTAGAAPSPPQAAAAAAAATPPVSFEVPPAAVFESSGGFATSFDAVSFGTSFADAFDNAPFEPLPASAFGEPTPFGTGADAGAGTGGAAHVPHVPAGVQGEAEAAFEEMRQMCISSHAAQRELAAKCEMLTGEVRRLEVELSELRAASRERDEAVDDAVGEAVDEAEERKRRALARMAGVVDE